MDVPVGCVSARNTVRVKGEIMVNVNFVAKDVHAQTVLAGAVSQKLDDSYNN